MKILCVDMLVTRLDVLYAEVSFRKQVQSHRFWSLRHPPHESLKALAEFLMTEKLEADKLAMTIPGHLCSYHLFHVPFTKKKEILLNVPFEVEERGPFTPEEILHSFQVLNKTKHQSEIMAAIIPKNLYNEFIENIRTFNLEPEIITPGPIALAYSLLPFSKNSQGPMMCIDVRDTYTYIVVTHQQSVLACRTYPLGLNHFVVPEATIRGISYDEAYQDLMQSGPHIPPGEISDELRDIIKPFFVEIKKTILNVRSGGHPYISAILPSGYAQEWQSFEELLLHEFQIPVDRHMLREQYGTDQDTPSLITNGMLQHFTSRDAQNLINFRVKELRAKQSIQELVKKFQTPERRLVIKYSLGTLLLLFCYFFFINMFLGAQRDRMETQLKETLKQAAPYLPKYQSLGKSTIVGKRDELRDTMKKMVKTRRMELNILEATQKSSLLDRLQRFVRFVPPTFKSDVTTLTIEPKTLYIKGTLFEGDFDQFRKRMTDGLGAKNLKEAALAENKTFTITAEYEEK